MRGRQDRQISMLCALNPDDLVPAEHPLRGVKELAEQALRDQDGTLIEAWASMKSFRPKDSDDDDDGPDNNGWSDFRGTKRSNKTHESTTDPEAKLARKGNGKEAKLSYAGHALMENRNGLLVDFELNQATGRAEIEAASELIQRVSGKHRVTLAADRGYDCREVVQTCRTYGVTPHVAPVG